MTSAIRPDVAPRIAGDQVHDLVAIGLALQRALDRLDLPLDATDARQELLPLANCVGHCHQNRVPGYPLIKFGRLVSVVPLSSPCRLSSTQSPLFFFAHLDCNSRII